MKHMEYEITDLQQLSKCRELLLKKECVRIDFGNSNYIKKTGMHFGREKGKKTFQ